jgi:hypothetical protein
MHDVDIELELINTVGTLKEDPNGAVAEVAENVDHDMTRTKTVSKFSKDTEDEKIKHETNLPLREKVEEENRKKRDEEEEESNLGQWMIAGLPKTKYPGMRRGTGVGVGPRFS